LNGYRYSLATIQKENSNRGYGKSLYKENIARKKVKLEKGNQNTPFSALLEKSNGEAFKKKLYKCSSQPPFL
jgi:hypothetical protein